MDKLLHHPRPATTNHEKQRPHDACNSSPRPPPNSMMGLTLGNQQVMQQLVHSARGLSGNPCWFIVKQGGSRGATTLRL